jgi:hypothetical protein
VVKYRINNFGSDKHHGPLLINDILFFSDELNTKLNYKKKKGNNESTFGDK